MKSFSFKDKTKRESFKKYELEKLRTKALCYSLKLPYSLRFLYFNKLFNYDANSSNTRSKNRCLITNRSQSVYRTFSLNRITLREFNSHNLLQGVRKSSW